MLNADTRLDEALFNLESVLLSLVAEATIDNHPEHSMSVLIGLCENYIPAEA